MGARKNTGTLNQIPIQRVAAWLGLTLPKKGSIRCLFPDHEDKKPSFEIKSSGIRWICYGCNRKGGSIDLVKEYNKMGFLAAKQWLESKVENGISAAPIFKRNMRKRPDESVKPDNVDDSREYIDIYNFLLTLCPLLENGSNYLLSRGITAKTISAFKVAQISRQEILPKLFDNFRFEHIYAAGLLTKKSIVEFSRIIFPQGSIIFPFFEGGKVVYLQARALDGVKQHGKWTNLNFHPRRIYNADAITQDSKLPFAICEGVIDTLSAIELGYNAVGMIGVTAKFTPDQKRALRKKEVEILLDWDAPGEKRAQSLQEELNRYGIVSIRKKLPSKAATDLNEYLKEKRGIV